MADPLERWTGERACSRHSFQPVRSTENGRRNAYRCAHCGLTTSGAMATAYALGFRDAGGQVRLVAPSLDRGATG